MSVAFLFDHADIILSELKLLTTTLGVLYLASHASLRRSPSAAPPKKTVNHSEARLKLQTSEGPIMKTLPAETTLFELAQAVEQEKGFAVSSFSLTFPRKTFEGAIDFGKTLKEAGLVPSAVLNVK